LAAAATRARVEVSKGEVEGSKKKYGRVADYTNIAIPEDKAG